MRIASVFSGLIALLACRCAVADSTAWRGRVEADWVRQEFVKSSVLGGKVGAAQDAAGGVDGRVSGGWGFHTAMEANPWWEVDLQQTNRIDRVVVWNRCDAFAGRSVGLRIQVSLDGASYIPVYQHDGGVFYGYSDQKPLVVNLKGATARFVRLSLPGETYFHLDEVEVYPSGSATNAALHKPASQSSTSQWSESHPIPVAVDYDLKRIWERGQKLAASRRERREDTGRFEDEWRGLQREGEADRRSAYFRARWVLREFALKDPLLDFDSMLFVKRVPPAFPHMSDQHYGWWSRPGGGIYILTGFKGAAPETRCLTGSFAPGSFGNPDLAYDGRKVLFAYCRYFPGLFAERNKADKSRVPEEAFFHIYEMDVDGSHLRQLTHGRYDDFDPRYLPGGNIAFLSTRKGQAVQVSAESAEATRRADLPDSYVRCGGDNWRPVPVFTLHGMDADGASLRPLSAFENFEWSPSVAQDGRLLFTRWDYIDRFNGHFFSLWSANQDGTNPQLVYGNFTVKPQVVVEARGIPRSTKIVFTAAAHHSNTGGSICVLDRTRGTEDLGPITRITPEVCFPETEGWPEHYYASPWPLSEDLFLVGWADARLPNHAFISDSRNPTNAMGIYLLDRFGNQELLFRDPEISSICPIPLRSRPVPAEHPVLARGDGPQEGCLMLQDVYRGLGSVPRGTVKQLRVVAVPPKVQPQMNQPSLGISAEDPGKYVLGLAPVHADGSAYFRIPSGVPVFLQALDEQGVAVQTMRTLTYVMPGQTLACVGCHEHRDSAPPGAAVAQAVRSAPAILQAGPEGSWPLEFATLVQPVLDRSCVQCHQSGGTDPKAARLNLQAGAAYDSFLAFGNAELKHLALERDFSRPGDGVASNSRIWRSLDDRSIHPDLSLDQDGRNRLATWLDLYAQRQGHFSAEQASQLREFRQRQNSLSDRNAPL